MVPLSAGDIASAIAKCTDASLSNEVRGRSFEDLVQRLFQDIPGITVTSRNNKDAFATQEIDLAVWNDGDPTGLGGFPQVFLVECKNWSAPVGSMEVAWFDSKLRLKGCSFGILFAMVGITGLQHSLTAAHSIVAAALREERELIVLTRNDIEDVIDTTAFVDLIKSRMVQIRVSKPF